MRHNKKMLLGLPAISIAIVALSGCGGSSNTTSGGSGGGTPIAALAPTNLGAAPGNGNVTLSWTAATGAVSYNIYRGTAAGGEGTTPINALPVTITSFVDSGLTNGSTYFYVVKAVDVGGRTASTAEVTAKLVTPIPISNTLKLYAQGDAWNYNVTGVVDLLTGGQKNVTAGSYLVGVQIFPQANYPVLPSGPRWIDPGDPTNDIPSWNSAALALPNQTLSYAYNLHWNDGSTEVRNYLFQFAQQADGQPNARQVLKYGDTLDNATFATAGNFETCDGLAPTIVSKLDKDGVIVSTKIVGFLQVENQAMPFLPGDWSAATGLSSDDSQSVVHFAADGTASTTVTNHQHFALTVLGQSVVTVPLGTFTCWKCNMIAGYQAQDRTINTTGYWAPQLGAFVSMDTVEDITGVGQERLHFELKSTTVPPYNTIGAAVKTK